MRFFSASISSYNEKRLKITPLTPVSLKQFAELLYSQTSVNPFMSVPTVTSQDKRGALFHFWHITFDKSNIGITYMYTQILPEENIFPMIP